VKGRQPAITDLPEARQVLAAVEAIPAPSNDQARQPAARLICSTALGITAAMSLTVGGRPSLP
jgi:hypothetical protein